jgi:iron complex transport system substrate-binding protein
MPQPGRRIAPSPIAGIGTFFRPVRGCLAALAVLIATTLQGQAADPEPRRIVSLNLCADQLLLALADGAQIHSLSPLARDPDISFLARDAGTLPANRGRAESVLFAGPDLVLAGRWGAPGQRAFLERHGIDLLLLEPWRDVEQGRAEIRAVAARVGHVPRGEALVASIDAALARTGGIVPAGRRILTLYRRGWVPGTESLTGELLRHMGFTLHEEALGLGQGGMARLESLVANPPDYVLIDEAAAQAIDQGSALLVHPALLSAIPPERRLSVPGNLAICGGPSTPALIDALADEVRRKVR